MSIHRGQISESHQIVTGYFFFIFAIKKVSYVYEVFSDLANYNSLQVFDKVRARLGLHAWSVDSNSPLKIKLFPEERIGSTRSFIHRWIPEVKSLKSCRLLLLLTILKEMPIPKWPSRDSDSFTFQLNSPYHLNNKCQSFNKLWRNSWHKVASKQY